MCLSFEELHAQGIALVVKYDGEIESSIFGCHNLSKRSGLGKGREAISYEVVKVECCRVDYASLKLPIYISSCACGNGNQGNYVANSVGNKPSNFIAFSSRRYSSGSTIAAVKEDAVATTP